MLLGFSALPVSRMLLTTNKQTNNGFNNKNKYTHAVGRIHAVRVCVGVKCGWQICCWENELLGWLVPAFILHNAAT